MLLILRIIASNYHFDEEKNPVLKLKIFGEINLLCGTPQRPVVSKVTGTFIELSGWRTRFWPQISAWDFHAINNKNGVFFTIYLVGNSFQRVFVYLFGFNQEFLHLK